MSVDLWGVGVGLSGVWQRAGRDCKHFFTSHNIIASDVCDVCIIAHCRVMLRTCPSLQTALTATCQLNHSNVTSDVFV
jgi:hypothetical protein